MYASFAEVIWFQQLHYCFCHLILIFVSCLCFEMNLRLKTSLFLYLLSLSPYQFFSHLKYINKIEKAANVYEKWPLCNCSRWERITRMIKERLSLFFHKKHMLWCSLEPSQWESSNEGSQLMISFRSKNIPSTISFLELCTIMISGCKITATLLTVFIWPALSWLETTSIILKSTSKIWTCRLMLVSTTGKK